MTINEIEKIQLVIIELVTGKSPRIVKSVFDFELTSSLEFA